MYHFYGTEMELNETVTELYWTETDLCGTESYSFGIKMTSFGLKWSNMRLMLTCLVLELTNHSTKMDFRDLILTFLSCFFRFWAILRHVASCSIMWQIFEHFVPILLIFNFIKVCVTWRHVAKFTQTHCWISPYLIPLSH